MNKIDVGKIVNVRGIKGEIKIFPHSNINDLFGQKKKIYIDDIGFEVAEAKKIKNCAALKLAGIDAPEKAREYVGKTVYADENDLPETEKDEYYVKDILGITVSDDDRGEIGKISDVFFTGANDVYEITCENGKKVLIPAVKEFIKEVDLKGKKMRVRLIEGMIE